MKTKLTLLGGVMALLLAPNLEAQTIPGPQPNICTRACWVARNGTCTSTMTLNRAIIHHTAGSEYNTSGLEASKGYVRAIQNMDMDVDGWCDIGYHFMVDKFGNIFECRKNSIGGSPRGAHDSVNAGSFGFTFMGYFHPPNNNAPTTAMLNAMYNLIAWKMPSGWSPYGSGSYGGRTVGVIDGHRKAWPTACPGDGIHPVYITENYSGGPMRSGVAARRMGAPPTSAGGTVGQRVKGDFNGDGRDDVVMAYNYGGGVMKLWVYLSTGSSFLIGQVWYSNNGGWEAANTRWVTGDFNGDGLSDVCGFYNYGSSNTKMWVFLSTGSSFQNGTEWNINNGGWDWNNSKEILAGDFNGDGKTDICMPYDYGNYNMKLWVFLSTGSGFPLGTEWYINNGGWDEKLATWTVGDFNGDGRSDVTAMFNYGNGVMRLWTFLSTGSGFPTGTSWHFNNGGWDATKSEITAGDFNGDGKADLAMPYNYGNGVMRIWVYLSTGSSFPNPASVWHFNNGGWDENLAQWVAGDFNGDGRKDMTALYNYGGGVIRLWTYLSTGSGFPTGADWHFNNGGWDANMSSAPF